MGKFSRKLRVTVLLSIAAVVGASTSTFAITYSGTDDVSNYKPELENRFYQGTTPSPNYQFSDLDLSGVGNAPGAGNSGVGFGVWATMISPEYFLSATHVASANAYSNVTFYQGNGTVAAQQTVAIDTSFGVALDGSDLWLGKLSSPAPSWAKIYPVVSRPESTTVNYASFLNNKITIVGYRDGGYNYAPYNLGLNNIDSALNIGEYSWTYNNGAAYGDLAATTAGGDSSGPSFVKLSTGQYAVAGTHSEAGGDASVSAHIAAITSYVPGVQVMTDLPGDINGDFKVDSQDATQMSPYYESSTPYTPGRTYAQGDLNGDGYVNFQDTLILSANWGKTLIAPSDFNHDNKIDIDDAKVFADHWGTVPSGTHTDADINGDGVVDVKDVKVFDANMRYPGPSYPTLTVNMVGDFNKDGIRDDHDLSAIETVLRVDCCSTAVSTNPAFLAPYDLNNDGYIDFADGVAFDNLPRPYLLMDMDGDGKVGPSDGAMFFANWHHSVYGPANGDFDSSGYVDDADLAILVGAWGFGLSHADGHDAVPEPSTLVLLALGTLAPLIRKTRVS